MSVDSLCCVVVVIVLSLEVAYEAHDNYNAHGIQLSEIFLKNVLLK